MIGQPSHRLGLGDRPGGTDGQHTPALAHGLVHMVDLEGDVRSHGCRRGRVRRGPEDDRVVDDLVVHRNDRRAAGGRHRDTPQAVCGEPGATLVRAEVPQLGIEECLAPAGREIDSAPAQRRDGRAQRGGQPDETRQARVGRPLFEVGQVLRRHFGAPGCLRPGQSLSCGVRRPRGGRCHRRGTPPPAVACRTRHLSADGPRPSSAGNPRQGKPGQGSSLSRVRGDGCARRVRGTRASPRPCPTSARRREGFRPRDGAPRFRRRAWWRRWPGFRQRVDRRGELAWSPPLPQNGAVPNVPRAQARRMARTARPGVPNGLFSGRPAPQELSRAPHPVAAGSRHCGASSAAATAADIFAARRRHP